MTATLSIQIIYTNQVEHQADIKFEDSKLYLFSFPFIFLL